MESVVQRGNDILIVRELTGGGLYYGAGQLSVKKVRRPHTIPWLTAGVRSNEYSSKDSIEADSDAGSYTVSTSPTYWPVPSCGSAQLRRWPQSILFNLFQCSDQPMLLFFLGFAKLITG